MLIDGNENLLRKRSVVATTFRVVRWVFFSPQNKMNKLALLERTQEQLLPVTCPVETGTRISSDKFVEFYSGLLIVSTSF